MNIISIRKILVLGFLALVIIAMIQPAAHAVTDEEIASIGLSNDATSTQTAETSGPPTLGGIIGRLALSLGVVFALMGVVLWAARRYFPQGLKKVSRGAAIDILATRPLGQRRQLMLVRAQGKTLLLGVTPQAINCLTEIDDESLAWEDAATGAGLPACEISDTKTSDTTDMGGL